MDEHPILWKVRTRWAAVGAAVAVVAGAGGIAVSGATNAQLTPSKVNITPCRIMDTRTPGTVGPRSTPLGTGTTHTIQVTGKNGNCTIPSDAVSVMMNVTLVSPAQPGFITVFPAGATRPTASNLNYTADQAPTPNLVDATLSSTGQLSFYASAGNVDLVADITSYTTGARLVTSDLAQNRWDKDRAKLLSVDVGVGSSPAALAYDGTNIWVAKKNANSVGRIDAATGTELADIAVGTSPVALAYDGTNIWVANQGSDNVTRINAATGTKLADIAVGSRPAALAYDGTNMWVANQVSNNASRINATTGARLSDVTTGEAPSALAFDGTTMWVANQGSSNVTRVVLGTILRVNTIAVGSAPSGLAFDGTNIWVANQGSDNVTRINAATGSKLVPDLTVGTGPRALAFDGTNMWVVNELSTSLSRISATTGAKFIPEPTLGIAPVAIVFDGTSMWVADQVEASVRRLRPEG